MQVEVPAMTRPQIRRKLACERNSAAEDVGNIANAPVELTAAQGRCRLALAVVIGFGGGEEVDYVEDAVLWLMSPFRVLPASPLPAATASIKTQGRRRVAPIRIDLGED